MRKSIFTLLATLLTGASAIAQQAICVCGQIQSCPAVSVTYDNLECSSYTCFQAANGGYNLFFNSVRVCNPTSAFISIRPAASGVIINSITIGAVTNAPSNTNISLNILTSPNAWFQDVGSVTVSGNIAVYAGEVFVPLGTISGTWTLQSINNIEAGGSITANFVSTGSTGNGVSGDIAMVKSTDGSITGNLTANGKIDEINVAGTIGALGSLVAINCRNELRRLFASSVYANINTRSSGGSGDLWYMRTLNGPFVGSLTTTDIEAPTNVALRGVDIAGNLDANITCTGFIKESVAVDGAIASGRTITTAANGITKHMIINQDNNNVLWFGAVTVGSTALAPVPYYDNAPSALGGGAIGLAPFMVHYEACNPVAAGDPLTTLGLCTAHAVVPSSISKVSLTHYGPVGLSNGTNIITGNPPAGIEGFTVEVATEGSCTWTDITDSFVTKEIGGNFRTFDIEGPFSNTGPCFTSKFYRIKPVRTFVSGQRYPLVCRDVDGSPLAGNYEYIIEVEPPNCAPPPEDP